VTFDHCALEFLLLTYLPQVTLFVINESLINKKEELIESLINNINQ